MASDTRTPAEIAESITDQHWFIQGKRAAQVEAIAKAITAAEQRGRAVALEALTADYEQMINTRDYHGNCCLETISKLLHKRRKAEAQGND